MEMAFIFLFCFLLTILEFTFVLNFSLTFVLENWKNFCALISFMISLYDKSDPWNRQDNSLPDMQPEKRALLKIYSTFRYIQINVVPPSPKYST